MKDVGVPNLKENIWLQEQVNLEYKNILLEKSNHWKNKLNLI